MKKTILRITGLCSVATLMFVNVHVFDFKLDASTSLALIQNQAQANAEDGSGNWEEVIYQTYPRQITCKGTGPLDCEWP